MSSNNEYPTVEEISGWILAEAAKETEDKLMESHLLNLFKSEGVKGFESIVMKTATEMFLKGATPIDFGKLEISFGILLGLQIQKSISEKVDVKRVN